MTPKRLVELREALGYTQAQLAGVLGVAGISIFRWEKGPRTPTGIVLWVLEALEAVMWHDGKLKEPLAAERIDHLRRHQGSAAPIWYILDTARKLR